MKKIEEDQLDPTLPSLYKIADYLDVTVARLFDNVSVEESIPPPPNIREFIVYRQDNDRPLTSYETRILFLLQKSREDDLDFEQLDEIIRIVRGETVDPSKLRRDVLIYKIGTVFHGLVYPNDMLLKPLPVYQLMLVKQCDHITFFDALPELQKQAKDLILKRPPVEKIFPDYVHNPEYVIDLQIPGEENS